MFDLKILTPREQVVYRLRLQGEKFKDIAEAINTSSARANQLHKKCLRKIELWKLRHERETKENNATIQK